MSELLARITTFWEDRTPRERLLLGASGGAVLLMLLFVLVVQPIQSAQDRAERRLETAERNLELIHRMRAEYSEINGPLSAMERRIERGPRDSIFTTLENLATSAAVKIDSMEPQAAPPGDYYKEEKVQVVLKNVTLAQVTQYLGQIEGSEQVLSVKSLRIRTRKDKPELLDVTFTVSAFEPV